MWIAKLRLWAGMTAFALTALGLPLRANAQDNQAENIAAARSLGIEGVQLAEAGKCPEAIEKLTRAEALYHAPTMLGRLGECQVNVGQIVIGTENLNRVVREQLAANAPKAFKDAQARAQKALDAALPRIGHLTVLVEPKEATISVTVSGVAVPTALLGVERPTDPGSHEVVASAPGYITQRTTVVLAEAGREMVTLRLPIDPNAAKEVAPVAPVVVAAPAEPPPAAPPPQASQGTRTFAFVLIGTGVVGVAVGSITGAMALSKKGDLDCPQNHCAGDEADKLSSARTLATVSTIGFAVGIPAAAVGTVLLLTAGSSSKSATAKPARKFAASPYLGPTSAGVTGTFW